VVFGLGLEVEMGKRRRLRKSDGGQLEINRQDLAASDEAILPNVVVSDEVILLPHITGGDESSAEPHVAGQMLLHQMQQLLNLMMQQLMIKVLLHQIRKLVSIIVFLLYLI